MATLESVVQTPTPGDRVALYRLDASSLGGPVLFFCQAARNADTAPTGVTFGGQYYTPVDLEFTDFEVSSGGTLPTPKMRIVNTTELVRGLILEYGDDLLGCVVQRVRTFSRFLDGMPDADPTAYRGPDTFRIERKVDENAIYVEFDLSAAIDQEGKLLPGRQVLRDTCVWRYRTWDAAAGTFSYAKATCPYTGGACFDRNNNPVSAPNDACPRTMTACELRFGAGNPLPFGGFPGVARVRS